MTPLLTLTLVNDFHIRMSHSFWSALLLLDIESCVLGCNSCVTTLVGIFCYRRMYVQENWVLTHRET